MDLRFPNQACLTIANFPERVFTRSIFWHHLLTDGLQRCFNAAILMPEFSSEWDGVIVNQRGGLFEVIGSFCWF